MIAYTLGTSSRTNAVEQDTAAYSRGLLFITNSLTSVIQRGNIDSVIINNISVNNSTNVI